MIKLNFYKLPFHHEGFVDWVYDNDSNFIFQFMSRFTEKGEHIPGLLKLQTYVIDSLNSDKEPEAKLELSISDDNEGIINYKGQSFIMIRGWGNLTGTGAHNFSEEKAAKIQDDLRDFIITKLT